MALKQRFQIEMNQHGVHDRRDFCCLFSYDHINHCRAKRDSGFIATPQQQAQAKPITRVTIDQISIHYVQANETERMVTFDEITPFLQSVYSADPDIFVALC